MNPLDCQIFDAACLTHKPDNRRQIVLSEKRSEYRGINKNRKTLCVYHVDKCASMNWAGPKCDFLILDAPEKRAFFIELKDGDIIEAVDQLNNSITNLLGFLTTFSIFGRIVPKNPSTIDLHDSRYLRLQNRLKTLNGNLKSQNKSFEENL